MQVGNGVVARIADGGSGSEATVKLELRTFFPGLGGTIVTHEGVAAALRIEQKNQAPQMGHMMFLRHLVVKKLDDHFYRSGVYLFSHVPRVFGSISLGSDDIREAYIYEWAFGSDGFSWIELGTNELITLRDWNQFVGYFGDVGIDLKHDTTASEDGRVSQNIVHQYPQYQASGEMCCLWKRIDFGSGSIRIDLDRLSTFLHDQKGKVTTTLGCDRYKMLLLAVSYLGDRDAMSEFDLGRLEQLVCDYRRSSLRHFAFGFGPASGDVCLIEGTETLLRRS
jgi:hypothetical protein